MITPFDQLPMFPGEMIKMLKNHSDIKKVLFKFIFILDSLIIVPLFSSPFTNHM